MLELKKDHRFSRKSVIETMNAFTYYTYKNARSFKNVMNYKHDGYHLVSVIVLLQSYSIVFICQLLA